MKSISDVWKQIYILYSWFCVAQEKTGNCVKHDVCFKQIKQLLFCKPKMVWTQKIIQNGVWMPNAFEARSSHDENKLSISRGKSNGTLQII